MIGARLDLLARMAGHQCAISLVADDEVPRPCSKVHPSFASLRLNSLAVTVQIVLRSEYECTIPRSTREVGQGREENLHYYGQGRSTISGLMDAFATAVSFNLQYGVPFKFLVDKFAHVRFEPSR